MSAVTKYSYIRILLISSPFPRHTHSTVSLQTAMAPLCVVHDALYLHKVQTKQCDARALLSLPWEQLVSSTPNERNHSEQPFVPLS